MARKAKATQSRASAPRKAVQAVPSLAAEAKTELEAALALVESGKAREGEDRLRDGAHRYPDILNVAGQPSFRAALLRLLLGQRRWTEAKALIPASPRAPGGDVWHAPIFARAYDDAGQKAEAESWWSTAVAAGLGGRHADKVFRRGFILTTLQAPALASRLWGQPRVENLQGWTKTFFGQLALWCDPALNYARAGGAVHQVGVLGLCLNPFDGAADNQQVADALFKALEKSETAFYDYVDELSGSFVILYRNSGEVRILQDAAATKPVYHHRTRTGDVTVSNCARLVHYIHELKVDPRAAKVFKAEAYRSDPSRYLPGMITAYEGLLPLTANHSLLVNTGAPKRFFPRGPLRERPFGPDVIDNVAAIMRRQAEMIAALGRPMFLAATAGRDSRASAAAFTGLKGLEFFSFHFTRTNHLTEDTLAAKKLARISGVPIRVFDLNSYSSDGFVEDFRLHSPYGIWPQAAVCYLEEFPADAIHIRSTVSEIGRIFYENRSRKDLTPETLAKTYTNSAFWEDGDVITTMGDFIAQTDFRNESLRGYDFYDMFYWEHRNAKWQNVLCAEAEMATDVFIPYNNRKLLQLMMSVPYEHRLKADIHLGVVDKLMPEYTSVPLS